MLQEKGSSHIAASKIWPARQRTLFLILIREMDTMLRIMMEWEAASVVSLPTALRISLTVKN